MCARARAAKMFESLLGGVVGSLSSIFAISSALSRPCNSSRKFGVFRLGTVSELDVVATVGHPVPEAASKVANRLSTSSST